MFSRCGRIWRAGQPPQPGHQGGQCGVDPGGDDDREDDPDRSGVATGTRRGLEGTGGERDRDEDSRPLTVQLAVVAMAPALTAASASYPWRWKNLTRTAKTATSPPTSAMKTFDVSRATHRPNGSGPVAAPSSAQPSGTTGSVARTNVSATQPQLAPLMASRELPAPDSTPMISQIPISEPTANSRLAQLTRLASASSGTSMPAPAATASRSRGSRSF